LATTQSTVRRTANHRSKERGDEYSVEREGRGRRSGGQQAGRKRIHDKDRQTLGKVNGVQKLAVDVELKVVDGSIADADRLRALVAGKVIEHLLWGLLAAVDGVPDRRMRMSASKLLRADPRVTDMICSEPSAFCN
jgi:hypothetical protein